MKKKLIALSIVVALFMTFMVPMASATASTTVLDLGDGPVVINYPGDYTIIGTYTGAGTAITLNVYTNITLDNVTITTADTGIYAPYGASIEVVGDNYLPTIYCESEEYFKSLHIYGDGVLTLY